MKPETPQSITKKKSAPIKLTKRLDARMEFSFRERPISEGSVEKIIKDLIDWFYSNPHAKTISTFHAHSGLNPFTYYDLIKRFPRLKQAHQTVMHFLGNRLWELAVDRQGDWAAIKWRLPMYSKELEEVADYNASLAAKARESDKSEGNVQYIVVDTSGKKLNE